jgi:hypothetical protein
MGALMDLLDTIIDVGDLYARYGIKGCVLMILVVVLIIGAIIALAFVLGS